MISFILLQQNSNNSSPAKSVQSINLMEEIDIQAFLLLKKDGEDGPDVKGGQLDALIVHASKVQKVTESGKSVMPAER